MDSKEIERQQVEYVFGLTGGELESKPLAFVDSDGDSHSWLYHYDGFPEWATEDYLDKYENGVSYLTLISIDACYGSDAPDRLTLADGTVWAKVADYTHSGETECPLGSCGDNEAVGEETTEGLERCPLCEAEKGEEHGCIYLGPGVETVYRHVEPSCERCGETAKDCTNYNWCQCADAIGEAIEDGINAVLDFCEANP